MHFSCISGAGQVKKGERGRPVGSSCVHAIVKIANGSAQQSVSCISNIKHAVSQTRTLYVHTRNTSCHLTFRLSRPLSAGLLQQYTQNSSASSIDRQIIILFSKECALITRMAAVSYWREIRPHPFKWRLIEDLQSVLCRCIRIIIEFSS